MADAIRIRDGARIRTDDEERGRSQPPSVRPSVARGAGPQPGFGGFCSDDKLLEERAVRFTSDDFTEVLKTAGVRISMDGRGRWMDNVFIERLWRSLKYECVYLHEFESGLEARRKIGGPTGDVRQHETASSKKRCLPITHGMPQRLQESP